MNNRWFLILGLMLLTIGCSDPDVATVDNTATKSVPDPVKVEADSEKPDAAEKEASTATSTSTEKPASNEKAEADKPSESTPDAHAVLKDAIAKAKADDKALFVHFSADW